ncbi:MAG: LysR family transcriptional regulator [Phenylobacterium sp.]|uniref:LysR family transcriptional regulator n=1 Tax=Phenylobacterium sp. TaxID=1871053 RepID=UPI0012198F99|nr:LysR family transcriptional regulator [Phenylobacterium sp.]TAJ71447.1 MAG: LysR family transcriptional regulator [Phenylobacterium sp.]
MDSAGLAVFVQASQAGSVAAGARRLRISPLTAARRLSALETDLGVRLLHRTTRAISLTPEGETFLPHAMAVLEAEAAARDSVRPTAGGVLGLLRITTSDAFGRRVVTPIVADFMAAHCDVRVDLIVTDRLVDLVAEGVDVAIRIAEPADSSLIGRRLSDNRRDLYASPGYLATGRAPQVLSDLSRHANLVQTGVDHWPFLAGDRRVRIPVAGRFTATSIESLHAACLSGLGIGMFSSWVVRDDLAAGRLVRLPLADATPEPLAIWALYPSRRLTPAKVSAFIAFVKLRLGAV